MIRTMINVISMITMINDGGRSPETGGRKREAGNKTLTVIGRRTWNEEDVAIRNLTVICER